MHGHVCVLLSVCVEGVFPTSAFLCGVGWDREWNRPLGTKQETDSERKYLSIMGALMSVWMHFYGFHTTDASKCGL